MTIPVLMIAGAGCAQRLNLGVFWSAASLSDSACTVEMKVLASIRPASRLPNCCCSTDFQKFTYQVLICQEKTSLPAASSAAVTDWSAGVAAAPASAPRTLGTDAVSS